MSLRPPRDEKLGEESPSDFLPGLPELTAGFFWYVLRGAFLPSVKPQSYLSVLTLKPLRPWTRHPTNQGPHLTETCEVDFKTHHIFYRAPSNPAMSLGAEPTAPLLSGWVGPSGLPQSPHCVYW